MKPRIFVAGYYGYGNAGDEAILAAMVRDLKRITGAEIVVASGDPERTVRQHNVEAVSRLSIEGLAREVQRSDLVIVGGGGHFHDYFDFGLDTVLTPWHGALTFCASILTLAAAFGRRSMLYAVGVGPLETAAGRELTASLVPLCQAVSVRDAGSRRTMLEVLGPGADAGPIEMVADPAFGLQAAPAEQVESALEAGGVDPAREYLAVSLRHWDFDGEQEAWESEVAAALDRVVTESRDIQLVGVPMQAEAGQAYEDDRAVLDRVRSRLEAPSRWITIEGVEEPSVIAGVVARARALLAMRYHAALFGAVSGVPTVALAYDPKVSSLFEIRDVAGVSLAPESWIAEKISDGLEQAMVFPRRVRPPLDDLRRAAWRPAEIAESLLNLPSPRSVLGRDFVQRRFLDRVTAAVDLDLLLRLEREHVSRLNDAARKTRERYEAALAVYEGSVAVQLVMRVWKLMDRLLPPESRRRRAYEGARNLVFGRGAISPAPAGDDSGGEPVQVDRRPRPLQGFQERLGLAGDPPVAAAVFSAMRLNPDEGQRPTQLAMELACRDVPTFFVHWVWDDLAVEARDLKPEPILEIPHGMYTDWWDELGSTFPRSTRVAIIEWPHPTLLEAAFTLRSRGWRIMYELMDDWKAFAEAGEASWYQEIVEVRLVECSHVTTVINDRLAARARQLGAPRPVVVPNGVRPDIALVHTPRRMERGDVTVGYFGQTTNAWFDWDLVAETARRRPSWRFHLIGYGGSVNSSALPSNVLLLGRVPQRELAAVAANWDVAVVPFAEGPLAEGADPIKLYEYLAMDLPVVVTGVSTPPGAEQLVRRARGVESFIRAIEASAQGAGDLRTARRDFVARSTWQARVDQILAEVTSNRATRGHDSPARRDERARRGSS